MKINAIITGATGMVGEGVLHECLRHPDVEKVLVINRRAGGVIHEKLTEIIHADFFDFSSIRGQIKGYNACYFCLGVSSVGKKEAGYTHLTYDLTMAAAKVIRDELPFLTFCYVSGAGTDSTEKGRLMWARVKGRTENHLLAMGFADAYMFRPGFLQPTPGLKNANSLYRYFNWLFPLLKKLFPNTASTLQQLGLAMINVTLRPEKKKILEVKDIIALGVMA